MSKQSEKLVERIDTLLGRIDRSRYWLSKEASGGKNKGIVTDIERKGFIPSEQRLRRMAELLGTTTDYLLGRTENPAPVMSEVGLGEQRLERNGPPEPGIPLVGTGDCADLVVRTEDGQEVTIERASFDPDYTVQVIHRPPALLGNKDAYAIFFNGESMEPRFFAGEVAIADPRRHPGPGDFVIVQLNDGTGDEVVSVLVKRLVRASTKELLLEQYNPALVFAVPRERVVRFHRIIPPTEQLL